MPNWKKLIVSGSDATLNSLNIITDITGSDIKIDDWGSVSGSLASISDNISTMVDGSGTANYVTKWSDTDTITDSVIYDDGTNVGIGTTSPARKFVVSNGGASGIEIQPNYVAGVNEILSFNRTPGATAYETMRFNGGDFQFQTAGSERMVIDSSGNVGIGTDSPGEKLHVHGKAFINGQIYGGFGAITTSGTLDWNDSTNARSGNGHTLLRGNATNGPAGGEYYHPFSWEYASYDNDGNMTQFAIPYSTNNTGMYYRSRYDGTWNDWAEIVTTTKTLPGGPYLPLSAGSGEILTGDLAMNNNIGIITKDSSGVFKDVLKLNSSNVLEIGSSALNTNTIFRNTGNVGIGTGAPSAKLEVDGNTITTGTIQSAKRLVLTNTGSSADTTHVSVGTLSGSFYANTPTGKAIYHAVAGAAVTYSDYNTHWFKTGGNERMRITSTGNVGIGTTSPSYPLEIAQAGYGLGVKNFITSTDVPNSILAGYYASAVYLGYGYGSKEVHIGYTNSGDVKIRTQGNTIVENGNVGIGTTGPSAKLEVVGSVKIIAMGGNNTYPTPSTKADNLVIENRNQSQGDAGITIFSDNGALGGVYFGDEQSNQVTSIINDNTGGKADLYFTTNGNNERMRITSLGNVGIGTTNPSEKLHVFGGSAAIKIDSTTNEASLKYDNSTTTAVIKLANNDLKTELGGSEKMRILANGNVGIGTTSPSAALEVVGGIKLSDNSPLTWATSNTRIFGQSSYMQLQVALSDVMRLTSTGNVGIGTTSPDYKLTVQGNTYVYGGNLHIPSSGGYGIVNAGNTSQKISFPSPGNFAFENVNVGIGTTSPSAKLDIRQSTSGGSDVLGTGAITIGSDNPYWTFRGTATSLQDLAFDRNYSGTWYESMRIQRSTGNVGIGTTSPYAITHINGPTPTGTTGYSDNANSGQLYITSNAGGGTSQLGGRIAFGGIAGNGGGAFTGTRQDSVYGTIEGYKSNASPNNAGGGLSFKTNFNSTGVLTERMNITQDGKVIIPGNVGIGTTSPSAPLHFGKTVYGDPSSENFFRIKFNDFGGVMNDVGIGQPNANSIGWNIPPSANGVFEWNAGTEGRVMNLTNAGVLTLDSYDSTNNTGTPTYILGTDASGNVVKVLGGDIPGGGGTVTGTGTTSRLTKFTDGPNGIIGNSGIQDASNAVAITINGNEEVGINKANPTRPLHVNGIAQIDNGSLQLGGTSSVTGNNPQLRRANSSNDLAISTGGSDRITVLGAGNVGIGTNSPGVKLQLISADEQLTNFSSSVADQLAYSQINANSSTAGVITGAAALELVGKANGSGHGRHAWIGAEGTDDTTLLTKLKFKVRGQTAGGYNWAGVAEAPTIMTLEGDGNVGIGTTTPDARLTSFRNVSSYAVSRGDVSTRAGLSVKSSSNYDSKLNFATGLNSQQYIQGLNNAATTGRPIVLNPYGGYVGINTANLPTQQLDIISGTNNGIRISATDDQTWRDIGIRSYVTEGQANALANHTFIYTTNPSSGTEDPFRKYGATVIQGRDNGHSGFAIRLGNGGGHATRMWMGGTGATTFSNTVTATNFILSSDERLKENIEQVCDNRVKVDWKTFELKTEKGQKRYGVIAQELEKTNPEFVRENNQGFKSVAYIDLLIAKIAELEARLEKLEKYGSTKYNNI